MSSLKNEPYATKRVNPTKEPLAIRRKMVRHKRPRDDYPKECTTIMEEIYTRFRKTLLQSQLVFDFMRSLAVARSSAATVPMIGVEARRYSSNSRFCRFLNGSAAEPLSDVITVCAINDSLRRDKRAMPVKHAMDSNIAR